MKRLLKTISIMLILILSLTACAGNPESEKKGSEVKTSAESETADQVQETTEKPTDEPIHLTVYAQYSSDDEVIPYDYAIEYLKEVYPNVELELITRGQDENQQIKTLAAAGDLPDIIQMNLDAINMLKNSDNIVVLDSYLDELGTKDKVIKSAQNLLVDDDGHTYAFPRAGNDVVVLFYNKEIFEKNGVEVPTTFEEMMTVVEVLNANDVIPLSLFAKEKWPCVALYDIFASRYDVEGIKKLDSGESMVAGTGYQSAAEELNNLVKAGLLPDGATNLNYDQAAALFYTEEAAMFLNGNWEIAASTEKLGEKLGYMLYPGVDTANYESTKYAFSGGGSPSGFGVSANTEHEALAVEIASILAEKMAEARFIKRGNVVSPYDTTGLTPETELPPLMNEFAKDMPNFTSTTSFAWGLSNAKIKAGIEDEAQKLMLKDYSADEFVEAMDKVIEQANK